MPGHAHRSRSSPGGDGPGATPLPHTLELRLDPQGASVPLRPYAARTSSRSDVEVCCDFLAFRGDGLPPTTVALLGEAVEASRVDRAVGDDEGAVRVGAGGASGSVGAA